MAHGRKALTCNECNRKDYDSNKHKRKCGIHCQGFLWLPEDFAPADAGWEETLAAFASDHSQAAPRPSAPPQNAAAASSVTSVLFRPPEINVAKEGSLFQRSVPHANVADQYAAQQEPLRKTAKELKQEAQDALYRAGQLSQCQRCSGYMESNKTYCKSCEPSYPSYEDYATGYGGFFI
jgi:hypothetical protein